MLRKFSKKAQTTAEYAILIALVIAAVTAMQIFVKRGLQGKVKDVVDNMGTKGFFTAHGDPQYEPYYLRSDTTTNQQSSDLEDTQAQGSVTRNSDSHTFVNRTQNISDTVGSGAPN